MKLEAEDCPFVFAFHEACECLKEAMRCEEDWLVVSNEYTFFLESEANDLQDTKSSLQQKVRRNVLKHVLGFTWVVLQRVSLIWLLHLS